MAEMYVDTSSILPDCAACGGRVESDTDLPEGPTEICVKCGLAQAPMPDMAGIRKAVQASQTRRLLGPSCTGRRHWNCTAYLCECTCHDKGGDRVAS